MEFTAHNRSKYYVMKCLFQLFIYCFSPLSLGYISEWIPVTVDSPEPYIYYVVFDGYIAMKKFNL